MKGDFTRDTFRPERHYDGVRMQQGRVQLDADWNEQVDIETRRDRSAAADIIGPAGVPKFDDGFRIEALPASLAPDFAIASGRLYVDGILCDRSAATTITFPAGATDQVTVAERRVAGHDWQVGERVELWTPDARQMATVLAVDADGAALTLSEDVSAFHAAPGPVRLRRLFTYLTQPDLPDPPDPAPASGGWQLVYLDVWDRSVSAVEDPDIREVALGGPDTATRVQTVCQVKVRPLDAPITCEEARSFLPAASRGRLTNKVESVPDPKDPCILTGGGGYHGLENRLYRVEIHDGGDVGTATFKWSRDNGSVLFSIEDFVAGDPDVVQLKRLGPDEALGLRPGDWVEVLDDTVDLHGAAGTMAQIVDGGIDEAARRVTLSVDVTAHAGKGHPRLRRWDRDLSGAGPAAVGGLFATGADIALEDGISVSFTGAGFQTGDYWVFPARTATADIEPLAEAPPQGIIRHRAPLALIQWRENDGEWQVGQVIDCRDLFPPLTNICAEDVCFDNSACQLPEVETVQDAIEALCGAHDMSFHNKRLHGWGIVCGLQVVCGPNDGERRRNVTVRPGYAIDCEGRDIELRDNRPLDVLQLASDAGISLDSGEVCLTVAKGPQGEPLIEAQPFDPEWNTRKGVLEGSLLNDFLGECVQPLVDAFGKAAEPPNPNALVTATDRVTIALANLFVQVFDPANGRFVYLSRKEHDIMARLNELLPGILDSETFCAMDVSGADFPPYPFDDVNAATLFGKGMHQRLRLHPDGKTAYTIGSDSAIHVYDLGNEEMVARITFPGAGRPVVQDVAFSADGQRLFATALVNGTDTLYAVADIANDHTWGTPVLLPGIQLVTLGTTPTLPDRLFAVGKGRGLFGLDAGDAPNPRLLTDAQGNEIAFNATGSLEIAGKPSIAFVTISQAGVAQGVYDSVRAILLDGERRTTRDFPLVDPETNQPLTGRDGLLALGFGSANLAVNRFNSGAFIVAADAPDGSKMLLLYGLTEADRPTGVVRNLENSPLHLAFNPNLRDPQTESSLLVVAFEESYRLGFLRLGDMQMLPEEILRWPVQMGPSSIAYAPDGENLYVLNRNSNTINRIGAEAMSPRTPFDLATLTRYRAALLRVLLHYTGAAFQHLKDCLCERLLVDCTVCNEKDRVYLGCVELRNGQVYKICNLTHRRYVKTFPTVEYWLSLVPLFPMIGQAVTRFCCAAAPSLEGLVRGRFVGAFNEAPDVGPSVRPNRLASLVHAFRDPSARERLLARSGGLRVAGGLLSDWVTEGAAVRPAGRPRPLDVVGQPLNTVRERLRDANVTVDEVQPYDPATGLGAIVRLASLPDTLPAGTRVRLFEENGVVKDLALAPEAAPGVDALRDQVAGLQAAMADAPNLLNALNAREAEYAALRQQLADAQGQIGQREQEIAALRTEVQTVRTEQARLAASVSPDAMSALNERLKSLDDFRTRVLRRNPELGGG
ncbi:MAG TPA: DUF6519 domain-containing protein [Armatimonadota bacterium]|jgi:hypothetical protein